MLVVGAGKRVLETALPALAQLHGQLEIEAVCGRKVRPVSAAGRNWIVERLDSLSSERLRAVNFVYVAVGKASVAPVLTDILARGAQGATLLLETPGLLLKHLRHRPLLARFRAAWIAEDCAFLPWIECARSALARADLGPPRAVVFLQSAYAYHGVATARALLGASRVTRGRRNSAAKQRLRSMHFDNGGQAFSLEPRDYSIGRLAIFSERGLVSDAGWDERIEAFEPHARAIGGLVAAGWTRAAFQGALRLEPECAGGQMVSVRCGSARTPLDQAEQQLAARDAASSGIVQRMESMKRVGFLRLVRSLLAGGPAHPVELGLEDMLVDWWLERPGFWRDGGLTSLRSPVGRGLYGALSRLAGK